MMVVLRTLPKVFQPIAPEHFERLCHVCGTESTPSWRRDELGSMLCNICYIRQFSKDRGVEAIKGTEGIPSAQPVSCDLTGPSTVATPPVQQGQEQTSTPQETPESSSNAPGKTSVERVERPLMKLTQKKLQKYSRGLMRSAARDTGRRKGNYRREHDGRDRFCSLLGEKRLERR